MTDSRPSTHAAPHRFELIDPSQQLRVPVADLYRRVASVITRMADEEQASFVADKIVCAEAMHIPTHGLHYFMHSLFPLLEQGKINRAPIETIGNAVISSGAGGIGFLHLHHCLERTSQVASEKGIGLCIMKMPGKVGALRVYCKEFMDRGQLIIMLKNTARTVGIPETGEPIFGTNPLCIGLPDTGFIYDASMSTTATNKIRLAQKSNREFPFPVGVDQFMQPTGKPEETINGGGFLVPFSFGPFWFKSFYLGIAIESIAALVGGSTSKRVGEHTGKRLHSREGMLAVLIDKHVFPDYENYLDEVGMLLEELRAYGLRVPGEYDAAVTEVPVFRKDWEELLKL